MVPFRVRVLLGGIKSNATPRTACKACPAREAYQDDTADASRPYSPWYA